MVELERFEIIEKIGEGSMGEVYKARQLSMDRDVAVKVLFPELAEDMKFAERFMYEARSIGKLNHPNVVQGIDFGRSGEHLYFVMEYVNGPSLYEIINQELLDEDEVLEIGLQVARALEHGHAQSIIHRDIKPGNIMISTEGNAKVTDYGLAKRPEGDSGKSTAAGKVLGTPYYISPEQARGEEDIDIRSDIYSLGATLYHAATGKPPFPGKSAPEIMSKALNDPVPDPRKENPELTSAFAKLVQKLMQKDRDKRPADPAELISVIEKTRRQSASERQRQSIGANLKGTLRKVVSRAPEGERGASPKVKLAIAGIIAAIGLVVAVFVLLPGVKKNGNGNPPINTAGAAYETSKTTPRTGRQPRSDNKSYVEKQEEKAEAELAEKAREAYLSAEAFARGADDVNDAIVRLHEVAAAYSGPYADKARELAGELKQKWEIEGVQELARRKQEYMKLVSQSNYGGAIKILHEFPERLRLTAAGEEAYRLEKTLREEAISEYEQIKKEAEALVNEGKYDQSVEKYERALLFNIEDIAAQTRGRIAAIRKESEQARLRAIEEKTRLAEKLYGAFFPRYSELTEKGDFKGALSLCESIMADETKQPVHARVQRHLADARMVVMVEEAGLEAIRALKLQNYKFVLEGGKVFEGVVREVKDDLIDLEITKMQGAIIGIEISRISGPTYVDLALRVLGDKPESHLACGVFLLLKKKDASAQEELKLAEEGGLDVSRYEPLLKVILDEQLEARAEELLEEFRKQVKRKKWEEAAEIAEELTDKYGDTKVVQTSRSEIEKEHTNALMKAAAEDTSRAGKQQKLLPGLIGSYYHGRNFNDFIVKRIDGVVDFDWGDRRPHEDVRPNNFSVRWEGFIVIPKSGRYTLIFNSDDGCRMWLEGQELFNEWIDRGPTDSSREVTLKKGVYPIKIEYYEAGGGACAKLYWSVSGSRQIIPAQYLCHSAD